LIWRLGKINNVKRWTSVALNLLAAASLLFFLVAPLLEGQSPMHVFKTRVWVHQFPDLSVEVPDGSGFRAIIFFPGFLTFVTSVAFPAWWIRRRWSRLGHRDAILLSLLMMWVPLVSLIDNSDEALDRLAFALIILAILGGGACLIWGSGRAIAYLMNYPERKRIALMERGQCAHCGYNLFGNVSGVCPECGRPTPGWQIR
jgi:hypothetical protein